MSESSAIARGFAWPVVIAAFMTVWSVLLFFMLRDAFAGFRLGRFDLGNMVQAVWSTTQGRPLEMTDGATGEQVVRLAAHVDPLLVLLAPLWMLWPSPLALGLVQIAVVALGALPVYWLGRRHLASERAAGLLALAYLAYPWLAWSALAAMHPVTFAISFYLFAIWALDRDRLALFAVFAALAMSTGELMGLPIAALGLWYAMAHGRRVAGTGIALAGALWTVLAVYFVVPAARNDSSAYYEFYDAVGGSPQGVLRTLVVDPGTVVGALVESHDIAYLVLLALPLAGMFVLAPGIALVAVPQLLANLLSDFRSMTDPRYHSVAAAIPFLVVATVFGASRLSRARQVPTIAFVLVVSVASSLALGPWARAIGKVPLGAQTGLPPERVDALREATALIPDGAPVSASNAVGAHLSARRYVYSVPVLGKAEWVVVDEREPWVTRSGSPILTRNPEVVRRFVLQLKRDSSWRMTFAREGVLVFRSAPGP